MLRQTLFWFDLTMTSLGLIGNAITVRVLCQSALRSSTSVFLLTMAVYDSLYLVSNLIMPIDGVPYFILDINFTAILTAEHFFVFCSVYTVVMVTLERYLAVSRPLRARRICTIKNAVMCVVAIFIISIVFTFPRASRLFTDTNGNKTTSVNCFSWSKTLRSPPITLHTWCCSIIPAIVILIIPFPIILIFNLLIVRALVKRKKNVRRLGSNDVKDVGSKLTRASVGITMCYFICCVFPGVYYVVYALRRHPREFAIVFLDVANSLIVVNCSTNFILYCLLGRTFRQVLINVIKHCPVVTWYRSSSFSRSSLSDSSVFENAHLKPADNKQVSHV